MLGTSLDVGSLTVVLGAALIAGFISGFAGFGAGLVASGLWLQVLPATFVPPMVALLSVVSQTVGIFTVRKSFDWSRAAPYLVGGVIGVPLGVAMLAAASPFFLRASIGVFLFAYAGFQLLHRRRGEIGGWGGKRADSIIGVGGGFLGGFAGLSGPLPLIWLQLRGGSNDQQRAVYQPFNFIILGLSAIGMAVSGQITAANLLVAAVCLPVTFVGAWIGARVYINVSSQTFQRVVLCLLLASGSILIVQALAR